MKAHPSTVVIMITPNNAAPEAETNSDDPDEICVPLEAVQIDGHAPAVGDDIETKMAGKVTRVTDKCVFVKPATFDGVPAPTDDGDEDNEEGDDDMDMMDVAKKADDEGGDGY